ncbi:unnamed protein product [Moneuplotes crassus]|uniref:ABC transporter domain-containing protein n=1 Tax=Euplotes crassus TaxID=5936 RepID=A0AAD1TYP4_EUPCR|nr:unnamed protein product [Moneuplotes crassus]
MSNIKPIATSEEMIGKPPECLVVSPKISMRESKRVKISWKNLRYTVRVQRSRKQMEELGETDKYYDKELLKPQNGFVQNGEAMFIMGSSGAGKTTLLNALCDRLTQNKHCKLEGEVLLNDTYPVTQRDFGKYGGYVTQDDILFPTLTVYEALVFAARLKINIKGDELKQKVEDTLGSLSLRHIKDRLIGNSDVKGLGPADKKKTSIAIELISNPSVLFLDEPTSGLDSFTANKIVELLKNQARLGTTIIATIHQPSSSTFGLFDRLLLLMDGNTIYQGDAQKAASYFETIGFFIPTFSNPADYFLKEFFIPYKKEQKDIQKLDILIEGYNTRISQDIKKEDEAIKFQDDDEQDIMNRNTKASPLVELGYLILRTAKNTYRNPSATNIRITQAIMMVVLITLCFWDLGTSERDINGKVGFIFFLCVSTIFNSMNVVLVLFISERPVFIREYSSKTYGVWSYYLSKSIVEVPFEVIAPLISCLLVYFTVGLTPDFDRFVIFCLVTVSGVLVSTSFGFFIGCLVRDPSVAAQVSLLMYLPFVFFGGFFVNLGDVFTFLRWIQYLSPIRYMMEAFLRNEFEDNSDYPNGDQIYEKYHYDLGTAPCILIVIVVGIALRMIALLTLKLSVTPIFKKS